MFVEAVEVKQLRWDLGAFLHFFSKWALELIVEGHFLHKLNLFRDSSHDILLEVSRVVGL